MSDNINPEVVIDAITNDVKEYNQIKIHSPTIRHYAFLEKIKSPFIFSDSKFDLENTIPSIYILTLDRDGLKKLSGKSVDEISDYSFDWADDNIVMTDIPKIIEDTVKIFTSINDSAPQNTTEKKT